MGVLQTRDASGDPSAPVIAGKVLVFLQVIDQWQDITTIAEMCGISIFTFTLSYGNWFISGCEKYKLLHEMLKLSFRDCDILLVALGLEDQLLHLLMTSLPSSFSNWRLSKFFIVILYSCLEIQWKPTTPRELGIRSILKTHTQVAGEKPPTNADPP